MKSIFAALLITASFAAIAQNPPAITPEARNRFLDGVNDFAGGKTTPGAPQDPPRIGAPGGGNASSSSGSNSAPASWRSPDGKVTSGSIVTTTVTPTPLVGPTIVAPTVTAPVILPPNNQSPWKR
jgi:hypothetical protein